VYAKLWIEGTTPNRRIDFYSKTMIFTSVGQLHDKDAPLTHDWIKTLQENGYCTEFLMFCCEVQVKSEPKVEEPKIVESKIVEPKVPKSYIELRQNLWSLYNEGLHRNTVTLKLEGRVQGLPFCFVEPVRNLQEHVCIEHY